MAAFAVLHIWAFSWQEYTPDRLARRSSNINTNIVPAAITKKGGPFGLKALAHALNPWDIVKALSRGVRWVFVGRKKRHTESLYSKDGLDEFDELGIHETKSEYDSYEGELLPESHRQTTDNESLANMPSMMLEEDGYESMRQNRFSRNLQTNGPVPYPIGHDGQVHYPKDFA